jgi:hypothetical protein
VKSKVVLITYLGNGSIVSQATKEVLFNRLLSEMTDEGREVERSVLQPKSKSVKFDDGSKLMLFPINVITNGMKATHLYVDEEITNLPDGSEIVSRLLKPCLLTGDYERFDTSGKQFSVFSLDRGDLKIK